MNDVVRPMHAGRALRSSRSSPPRGGTSDAAVPGSVRSTMARFPPEMLQRLDATEEIDLETRRRNAPARRTTMWVVVSDGRVYVRSIRGTAGRWYRELRAARQGIVRVGRRAVPVRAVAVRSPKA